MYIKISNKTYPCAGYTPRGGTVIYRGVGGLELPVVGAVTLCADDGFALSAQDAAGYQRQLYEGGVLTLTNDPEPEPMPEPTEPPIDPVTSLELALAELAEIILGG